ncbi:MAG: aryl-sulfate sulfotransferase [Verrucomicrobiota bacterium]|nr:aryl-sulfate sulfotransferase [Verrucomicrobiota bacterium]
MQKPALYLVSFLTFLAGNAFATQADDTVITITGQTAGPTPFISQLSLSASDTSVLKSIQFTVTPKPGSVTRPLSGTYSQDYMVSRGYFVPPSTDIFLPIYGLYDGFTNTVALTYRFLDGSSKSDSTTITTEVFDDPGCGYKTPTVLQARTDSTELSYDYIMIKGRCDSFSPAVVDTDGEVRWVGSAGISDISATFYDNAFFIAKGTSLYRLDLDGAVTFLHDYSDIGVTFLHHTIDLGKVGLILDANTTSYFESTNIEVDRLGNVVKIWDLAEIISSAMIAGGDDPSEFVYPTPDDWFHNNAVTYNRADDSLAISSREDFVICLDYESGAIKWILGDQTKKWGQFPSLTLYALDLGPDTLAPIGQHALSITHDQKLLLFDNGYFSAFQQPPGVYRPFSAPRKYEIDQEARLATEVWNFEMGQSVFTPLCASVYEDAPFNYLIDYSFVNGFTPDPAYAQLLGLDAGGKTIFYYQYGPTTYCNTAFNAIPLHLESTRFPTVGPKALNLSTRGNVGTEDDALIGGFIVTGTENKKVALRVLGPSLSDAGVADTLADPVMTLHNSTGAVIATNDDWQTDAGADDLTAEGLAPGSTAEAATVQTLTPGSYTVVATGKDGATGLGLVEAYDLSAADSTRLANLSTRAVIGTGDKVLIGGFIVGDVANSSVVLRALGPSLAPFGVNDPLSDPILTVYDGNGVSLATNDNWQDGPNALDLTENNLAPGDPAEAATILFLPAGAYTTIVNGAVDGTGTGLLEIYNLDSP